MYSLFLKVKNSAIVGRKKEAREDFSQDSLAAGDRNTVQVSKDKKFR